MRLINLLRQEVRIIPIDGSPDIVIPSSGSVFVNESTQFGRIHDDAFGDIPVNTVSAQLVNMPDPQEDIGYIVPWKALQEMRATGYDTSDIYCPDTSVRQGGAIIGSRALVRYA